jgi:hypothetical protein
MELELTHRDIRELYALLSHLKHIQPNPKAGYTLAKDRGKLKVIVDAIVESGKFGETKEWKPRFDAWTKDRDDTIKAYAKDEGGTSIARQTQDGQGNQMVNRHVPPEKLGPYLDAIEKLREKHKEVLDAMEAHLKEFDNFLDSKEKIDIWQVKAKDIPKGLNQEEYNVLYVLFEEPGDTEEK